MDFLADFNKLFNRKIISFFIWIYLYCFLFSLESNIFVCSYIQTTILVVEDNLHFIFIFIFIFVTYAIKFKLSYNKNKILNYIIFNYTIVCFKKLPYLDFLNTYVEKLKLSFTHFINLFSNNIYITLLIYCYTSIKNNILVWYPIYKSYSIFGFYKSTRLKFIDLKNENLKRFKY